MSDSNNDTSAIDEKKGQSNNDNKSYSSKAISFLTSVATAILLVLIYFSTSSLILFVCKIAQANILPTDVGCAPYSDTKPNISPSPIKTNIFPANTDPETSMKVEIPYDDYNSKNQMIETLKYVKDAIGPSPIGFLTNYLVAIAESSIQFNYFLTSPVMNLMNESFPETFIVLFGPIIAGLMYGIGLVLNVIYFVYLWFTNMYWFFKTNRSGNDGKPKWDDLSIYNPVDWLRWWVGFWMVVGFSVLLFFFFPFVAAVPISVQLSVILSLIFYKGKFKGKMSNAFSIIPELLKHYKITVTGILSVFVILLAFSKLGTIGGISAVLSVILIYAGIIGMDIYKSPIDLHQTPVVSYNQAKRTCSNKGYSFGDSGKHGPLYKAIMGQNGGGLTREIKKIGQKLMESQ